MPSSSPSNFTGTSVSEEIDGNLAIKTSTGTDGNLTVAGTLAVTGATTQTGNHTVTGNESIGGTLAVTGATTLTGGLNTPLAVAQGGTASATAAAAQVALGVPALGATVVGQSAITTTALTDIGPTFSVPGGLAAAGVTYRLYGLLDLTAVGTATDVTHTIGVYWGGTAGTALLTIAAANNSTSLLGEVGYVEVEAFVSFTSATATTTTLSVKGPLGASGAGTAGYGLAKAGTSTGLSSSAAEVLTLGWTLSATTGTPSILPELTAAIRVA